MKLWLNGALRETVWRRKQEQEMAHGELNGHVTDNVTWHWEKVKVMTPNMFRTNNSKKAGDAI